MNRIAFDFGLFQLYWYSLLILVAIIIGFYLVENETKRIKISSVFMTDLCFSLVPVTIVGARLYFVIFNYQSFTSFIDIFKIWEGGLAIYGAIISGIIWTIYYSKKRNINPIRILDILVVSLILGQAIGRWGNFFNQEAYGPETTLAFLQSIHLPKFIIEGMNIYGTYYQPMFLYESLWCILGFILLLIIRRYSLKILSGNLTAIYFIWYGVGRFVVEGFRQDSLMFMSFRISQIVSVILILIGVIWLLFNRKSEHYLVSDVNNVI